MKRLLFLLLLISLAYGLTITPKKTVYYTPDPLVHLAIYNDSQYIAKDINLCFDFNCYYIREIGPGEKYYIYIKPKLNLGLNELDYNVSYTLYLKYLLEPYASKYYKTYRQHDIIPLVYTNRPEPKISGDLIYYTKSKVKFELDVPKPADISIKSNCDVLPNKFTLDQNVKEITIIPNSFYCVLDINVKYYINDVPVKYVVEKVLPVQYKQPIQISYDKNSILIKSNFDKICYNISSNCEIYGNLEDCGSGSLIIPITFREDCPITLNVEGYVGNSKYVNSYVLRPYSKNDIDFDVKYEGDKITIYIYNLSKYPLKYEYLKLKCDGCKLENNAILFSTLEEYDYDSKDIKITPFRDKFKITIEGYGDRNITKTFEFSANGPNGPNILLYLVIIAIIGIIGYFIYMKFIKR
jgi:hypothetical protein